MLRQRIGAELALALPATVTVLVALFAIEELTNQRVLFGSLAASAYLIYHEPLHRMNTVRSMICSYLIATAIGVGAALLMTPGYGAAALALIATISLLIVLQAVHPPALAVALGLGFMAEQRNTLGLFLLSLAIVVLLVGLLAVIRQVLGWVSQHARHRHDNRTAT